LSSRRTKFSILGVVLFVGAYVVSILLYVDSGMGQPQMIVKGPSASDGTKVTIDVQEVQASNSLLVANVSVAPGPGLLEPQTHTLKEELNVVLSSTVAASKRTWPKGSLPDVFRVSLTLAGDVADWPFDQYKSGPVVADLLSGPASTRVPATVALVDRQLGWEVEIDRVNGAGELGPYQVEVYRSTSTVAFAVIILGVLIALAVVALFVAIQTSRDKRPFQPPMTTWYAAMVFAVVPLRNALPDAPPFGSWIDVAIVSWVIVVLVTSMVIYISCWWRHLRPAPDDEPPPEAN
jgi:hypothetical protein